MAVTLVIGSVSAGTGVAYADSVEIPKGFLVTEPAAIAGPVMEDEKWWEISDSLTRQLELNPCRAKAKPRDNRLAIRTITYSTSAPSGSSEQLVLYGSVSPANGRSSPAAAPLCSSTRTSANGPEAGRKIAAQAKKMAKKVCALPGVCG